MSKAILQGDPVNRQYVIYTDVSGGRLRTSANSDQWIGGKRVRAGASAHNVMRKQYLRLKSGSIDIPARCMCSIQQLCESTGIT